VSSSTGLTEEMYVIEKNEGVRDGRRHPAERLFDLKTQPASGKKRHVFAVKLREEQSRPRTCSADANENTFGTLSLPYHLTGLLVTFKTNQPLKLCDHFLPNFKEIPRGRLSGVHRTPTDSVSYAKFSPFNSPSVGQPTGIGGGRRLGDDAAHAGHA